MNSLQIKSQPNKKPFKPTSCPQEVREQLCPHPNPGVGAVQLREAGLWFWFHPLPPGASPVHVLPQVCAGVFGTAAEPMSQSNFRPSSFLGKIKGMVLEPGLPIGPSRVQGKTTDRTHQDGCGASSPNTRSAGGPCTSPEYPSMEEMILPPSHGCKIWSKGSSDEVKGLGWVPRRRR